MEPKKIKCHLCGEWVIEYTEYVYGFVICVDCRNLWKHLKKHRALPQVFDECDS